MLERVLDNGRNLQIIMTLEDFKEGKDKCSQCGQPVGVICPCEVNNFKDNGEE